MDAFGAKAYPLTEKQIALITRILDEQDARNKTFREIYDRENAAIVARIEENSRAAAARTPEQKLHDAIRRLITFGDGPDTWEWIEAHREKTTWGEFVGEPDAWGDRKYESMGEIPAPTIAETIQIAAKIYAHFAYLEEIYAIKDMPHERLHYAFYAIADTVGLSGAYEQLRRLRDGSQNWLGILHLVGVRR